MTARGFALLLVAAALVIGAAWLWFGRTAQHSDDALRAPQQPETSASADAELDDWPAGFGEGGSRAELDAPEAGATSAERAEVPRRYRIVVEYGGVPFPQRARLLFTRNAGSMPIADYGTTVEHVWPGDSGEIAIEIAPGLWSAQAVADDLESVADTVWLREASDEPLRLVLESPCRWIGYLVAAGGEPAADVALRVVARGLVLGSTRSAADGSFDLRSVPRPDAKLEIGDLARAAHVVELPADCRGAKSLDAIRLPPLASLTLEIDRKGHEQEAVLVLLQGEVGRSSVRRFAAGEPLEFHDLAPGRYRVFAHLPGVRGNLDLKLAAGTQKASIALRAWRPRR